MNRPKDLNAPSRWNMRIWDDYRKEWLCQSDQEALTYYGFDITGGETTEFQGLPKWHPDRHLIWEQSTGLLDRNGIEIYEGDLLRCKGAYGDDYCFKVVWAGDGWFVHEYLSLGCTISLHDDSARLGHWFDREVIGNIHENKELLGD